MRYSNILFIDESKASRRLYSNHFEEIGYRVFEASDANEAINILKNEEVCHIVTELNCELKTGESIIEYVNSRAELNKVHIFLVAMDEAELKKCQELDFLGFISLKTAKLEYITSRINSFNESDNQKTENIDTDMKLENIKANLRVIIHDINNPLAVALGSAKMEEKLLSKGDDEKMAKINSRLIKSLDRMNDLLKGLSKMNKEDLLQQEN